MDKDNLFYFKNFALSHTKSTLKIGTDSVLLGAVTEVNGVKKILDIGCGCGVIGFCLAARIAEKQPQQSCRIIGIDIDLPSIEEARYNAVHFPDHPHLTFDFQQVALQNFVSEILFDRIVSNPPYFRNNLKPVLPNKQIGKHQDYFLNFNDLIDGVYRLLAENGTFSLILPVREQIEFQKLTKDKLHLLKQYSVYPRFGKPCNRMISVYSKYPNIQKISTEEIIIRDENLQFTAEYKKRTENLYVSFGSFFS
jgi:tRNA1Val (adenine37-N6)-methyltransferase